MVIKLLPRQIPMFWEAIKLAAVSADEVDEKDRGIYLNDLLHSLLNEKSQCFARLDNERRLRALVLTKLFIDKITGEKSLFVLPLFSWKHASIEEWKEDFIFVRKFAEHEECKYIAFESRNPIVWQLGEALGFEESLRRFRLDLGGV